MDSNKETISPICFCFSAMTVVSLQPDNRRLIVLLWRSHSMVEEMSFLESPFICQPWDSTNILCSLVLRQFFQTTYFPQAASCWRDYKDSILAKATLSELNKDTALPVRTDCPRVIKWGGIWAGQLENTVLIADWRALSNHPGLV